MNRTIITQLMRLHDCSEAEATNIYNQMQGTLTKTANKGFKSYQSVSKTF